MLDKLNTEQRSAVERVYGPTLVIAGPGTGKTQLLSVKVAHILKTTDASPSSILCLTYTENAAHNMRERLLSLIGEAAHEVNIFTYHGFGNDLLNKYPDYFNQLGEGKVSSLQELLDEPAKIELITDIVAGLPYSNKYSHAFWATHDLLSTISEFKQALLLPDDLRQISKSSKLIIDELAKPLNGLFAGHTSAPRSFSKAEPLYAGILEIISGIDHNLTNQATNELELALAAARAQDKSTPLTAWANAWITKTKDHHRQFADPSKYDALEDAAEVYERYAERLKTLNQFDYDDMILKVLEAFEKNPESLANIQEKFQHILLDEFQDTNRAQFELVKQIASHPVHEGSPDITAVGDDDQAIFTFQGAEVANMGSFADHFNNVETIVLTKNYRSQPLLVDSSQQLAKTINSRLDIKLSSTLTSQATAAESNIERLLFANLAQELSWVASSIKDLIDKGTDPDQIAVIAPKHDLLMELSRHLAAQAVPLSYDRRDNLLTAQPVVELIQAARLVLALADQDFDRSNELFAKTLSQPYWGLDLSAIWQANWEWYANRSTAVWAQVAEQSTDLMRPTRFYLTLAAQVDSIPLEQAMDIISGHAQLDTTDETLTSPFKQYYLAQIGDDNQGFVNVIAQLVKLREMMRSKQKLSTRTLTLRDFVDYYDQALATGVPITSSYPLNQAHKTVKLLTTYGSKGLEFEHTYLIALTDSYWGPSSRGNQNKVSLPRELAHIRYAGSDEDELKRKLYVALTRAKTDLYLTSHDFNGVGKPSVPLKFFNESPDDGGIMHNHTLGFSSRMRPELNNQQLIEAALDTWSERHTKVKQFNPELVELLQFKLKNYRLSPTNLGSFIDLEHGGPDQFLLNVLLRFPSAATGSSMYGTAVHETLEYAQKQLQVDPDLAEDKIVSYFLKQLDRFDMSISDRRRYGERGAQNIANYFAARKSMLAQAAEQEVNFGKEGVVIGPEQARLTGKIDRLELDTKSKTARVIDFKTGKPHTRWDTSIKLLKYKYQLIFYKLLVENSAKYRGYTVVSGALEFTEPDAQGNIVSPLELSYTQDDIDSFEKLLRSVWQRINSLNLESPGQTDNAVINRKFIDALIAEVI